jgi:hypothetical protein
LGILYIEFSNEVERRLRIEIVKRFGGQNGNLSAAVEMAVKDWLKKAP